MTQRRDLFLGEETQADGGLSLLSGRDRLIQMAHVAHDDNRCTLRADAP